MSSSIKYYEVVGLAGHLIASFLDSTLAEAHAVKVRAERIREVRHRVESDLIVTEGERKGEMNYATYGVRVVERVIRFSDDNV